MFQIYVINTTVHKIMLTLSVLQVQSKIMYNNDHPDWNQILKIGIQFPSMCERLKFIVRDWYVSKEFQFIVKLNLDDTVLIYFFFVNDFSFKYAVCYQLFILPYEPYHDLLTLTSGICDMIEWSQKNQILTKHFMADLS